MNRIGREKTASVFTTCACVPEEILTAAGLHARRLLPDELESARELELHDQLALGTVLAARDGLAAMFSPDGEWPRNGLVQSVAERLECRILRLSFDNIPRDVIRRFRHSRYEA